MSEEFTFLMCTERCGSNLITKMLNEHSSINGPTVKHLLNPVLRNYFRYYPLGNPGNWEVLIDDVLALYNTSFSKWTFKPTKTELLQNIEIGKLSDLLSYFFKEEARLHGKSHTFIKEIKLYEYFPYLIKNFPNSKFIYQVRDPRDMAISWRKSKVHKGGLVAAARQWKNDQQQFLKCHFLMEKSNQSIIIKYEDLVGEAELSLKSICKFLNFEFENNMLNFHENKLTQTNAQSQAAWENLSKGLMTSNFGKFKEVLSDFEIKIIEKICFFEMDALGYKTINSWENLNHISENEIIKFQSTDELSTTREIYPGLKENIDAMTTFYQKRTTKNKE